MLIDQRSQANLRFKLHGKRWVEILWFSTLFFCLLFFWPSLSSAQSDDGKCVNDATLAVMRAGNWPLTLQHFNEKIRLAQTGDLTSTNSKANLICLRSYRAVSLGRIEQFELATKEQLANLEYSRSDLGEDHLQTIEVQLHLASIYSGQGRYDLSIPVNRQMLPKLERLYGVNSIQVATLLRNLSTSLHWVGNFADALAYDQRALLIVSRLERGPRGCVHEIDCQRMLGLAHSNLAGTLTRLGRHTEAIDHAQKGHAIQKESKGAFHEHTLDSQLILATVMIALGRHDEARALQLATLQAARSHLGEAHVLSRKAAGDYASSSNNKEQYLEANQIDRERLIQMRSNLGPNHPDVLLASSNLAGRLAALGQNTESLQVAQEAVKGLISRADTLQFDDRSAEQWEQRQSYLVDLYILALIRNRQFPDALLITEYFKQRNLSNSIELDARLSLEGSQQAALKSLRRDMTALDQKIAIARSVGQNTQGLIAQRSAVFNQWNAQIGQLNHDLPNAQSWPLWAQRLFKRGQPVLAYKFLGRNLYAFVLTPKETRVFLLESQDKLRPTINAYRLTMRYLASTHPGSVKTLPLWRMSNGSYRFGLQPPAADATASVNMDDIIRSLSDWLIKPIEPFLNQTNHLLISVDHNLGQAPFDELKLSEGLMGSKYAVSLLPSLTLAQTLTQRQETYQKLPRRALLAVGGAHYAKQVQISPFIRLNRETDNTLSPMETKVLWQSIKRDPSLLATASLQFAQSLKDLPGAQIEVQEITKITNAPESTTLLTGESASEETINRLIAEGSMENFKIIHFAAHGFLSDDEPGLSAIVLSQIRRAPATDGYLTAAELSAFHLRSDLVVVSACDSGGSEFSRGSGSIGLAYSLLQAGTISTILSLWPVPDLDTQRFMTRLYAQMRDESSPAVALQKTKAWARSAQLSPHVIQGFVIWGM